MIKKLYITILSMILLTLTFTTATFAWAVMGEVNRVDGFQITMNQGSNLEFSLDGINWSNEITTAQINEIWRGARLMDLTSLDGNNFIGNRLPLVNAELNFVGVPNKNYVSLELYVRTISRYHNLYLVDNVSSTENFVNPPQRGTYVLSKGVTFRSPVTFNLGPNDIVFENEIRTYFAKDAIRISLTELKTENPLDTRDNSELDSFIYDPSENPERGYAKSYGSVDYLIVSKSIFIELPTVNQPVIDTLSNFSPDNPYIPLDTKSRVATLIVTDQIDGQNRPYYLGKFRLNVWIEGWDADAFDAIFKDTLLFRFEFRTAQSIDI